VALVAQALRYWAIASLGDRWNTRIIVVPGLEPVTRGPYRFLRHPNYVAVVLELAAVPLIHGAWVTAAVFTLGNALLLLVRIRADEAVIRSSLGYLLEGSTTSLMWWRGDTLCTPAATTQLLPGVTSALLAQWALADGFAVQAESVTPEELSGLETWTVNALHGIRPVTAWVGADSVPGPATRARHWQDRLEALATATPTLSRTGSSQQAGTP